ncbi:MAG: SDR family oxidoreductase, partial [Actinobacteria bacterium]
MHADRPLRDAGDDAQRAAGATRVLITGAARGIGALTAKRLHQRGARVALLGLEPELLEAVAAECGGAPWFECDVADRDQVDGAVAEAVERLGGLDVAIANAGIGA